MQLIPKSIKVVCPKIYVMGQTSTEIKGIYPTILMNKEPWKNEAIMPI